MMEMHLKELKVKNFLSLKDFQVKFGAFNVLVGRNNTRKSNILNCLSFLSELATTHFGKAMEKRGGYPNVVFKGMSERNVEIEACMVDSEAEYSYKIVFGKYNDIMSQIRKEILKKKIADKEEIIFDRDDGNVSFPPAEEKRSIGSRDDQTLKSCTKDSVEKVRNFLKEIRIYTIKPSTMRKPLLVRKEYDIGKEGENSPLVLHTILSENIPLYLELQEALKSMISEVEELNSLLTPKGKSYIAIKEKDSEKPFDYHQIADGTLKLLAILLILFSPWSPSVLCIEEPEDYIHARLLESTVALLRNFKEQVIVTTHSPYFIDHVEPEDLIPIKKENGETKLISFDKSKIDELRKELSLGELYFQGEIDE